MAEARDADRPEPLDPQVKQRRRRFWIRVPSGCLVFFALMGLIGWAVVAGRARARYKDFALKRTALRARVVSTSVDRIPLEGEAVPGNGWQLDLDAIDGFEDWPDAEQAAVRAAVDYKPKPDAVEKAAVVLRAHPEYFAALKQAARADRWEPPFHWDQGSNMPLPWLAKFRATARFLALDDRIHRAAGELDASLDDVALGLQLASDSCRPGPIVCWLVGLAVRGITLLDAAALATDPALTPAQAARFERLLERAEEDWTPVSGAIDAEHLATDELLASIAEGRIGAGESGISGMGGFSSSGMLRAVLWKHGLSWRIAAADADALLDRATRCVRDNASKEWAVARDAYKELTDDLANDPLAELIGIYPAAFDSAGRSSLARLRILHAVLQERIAGSPESPLPADPFTLAPLHRRVDPDRVVFWSEWEDGDQGGKGGWDGNPEGTGDIVLEWKTSK